MKSVQILIGLIKFVKTFGGLINLSRLLEA